MTDKKDGPGKGAERMPSEGAGSAKRPFATLDLKATEVEAPKTVPAGGAAPQAEAAAKVAAASNDLGRAAVQASQPEQPAKPDSRRPELREAGGAASVAPSARSTERSEPAAGPGGLGRALSHLAAGVAGGLLAVFGAPYLAPLLGLEAGRPQTSVVSGLAPDYAARLNVLEKQVRDRLSSPAAEAVRPAAADDKAIQRMDELARHVQVLEQQQAKIAAEGAQVREELGRSKGLLDAADRLAKLEEQLTAMTTAAAADPQRAGRLPQLAQLTGQLADLKASIDNRLAAHRRDLLAEMEKGTAQSAEAAETAKAGAVRLDREVTGVKSDATKLGERVDQLKAGTDRLDQGLKALQGEAAALKAALEGLRADVSGQLKATAKPADVAMAVAPLAEKVKALETAVQGVVRAEDDRKANAERIVLSLELGNLKRAMERGQKYAPELAEVRKVAGTRVNLAALERFQNDGVPTVAELVRSFRPVAGAILDADALAPDSSVVDRLLSGAKSVVRVRKTTHEAGDTSAEAVVARMEAALKESRLADVISEAKALSPKAVAPAQDWLRKVDARRTVDAALVDIDQQLKASLGAGPAAEMGAKR